jgi:transposase-like protein
MLAVRSYLRFGLSYRDLEELLAERGIQVNHVTITRWVQRFTPLLADAARPCRHRVGDRWQVDETYVKVAGQWRYVYRAINQFGQVIDVYVSSRRDTKAAHRFFQRTIGTTKIAPAEIITDQAPTYPAVLDELLPAAWHRTDRYANNRVECDHGRLKARLVRCAASNRTAVPGWSSPAMRSCRPFGADTTSWRLTSPPTDDWRSRSTNWPWRSDPAEVACSLPGSVQRNSAQDRLPQISLALVKSCMSGDRTRGRYCRLARPSPTMMTPSLSGSGSLVRPSLGPRPRRRHSP